MLADSGPSTALVILVVIAAVVLCAAVAYVLLRRGRTPAGTDALPADPQRAVTEPASPTRTATTQLREPPVDVPPPAEPRPAEPAAPPHPVRDEEPAHEAPAEPTVHEEPGVDDHAPTQAPAVPSVRDRSERTRSLFGDAFRRIRGRSGVPQETWDDLEETLLRADIGVRLVDSLLVPLRDRVKSGELSSPDAVIDALRGEMTAALSSSDRTLRLDAEGKPNVWLFVGVNGVGKTTTIGKVGSAQTAAGRTVLMAAGDTFRAAAAEQLQTWAERCGAEFVRGSEGGDPASVIFDGIQSASARGIDLVLGDTAGRLQNKSNLMEELKKVRRVAEKAEGTVNEVLLVIDATTGQNGLSQAREFAAATDVTGVVLTKLDGSAKGGIVFAIETELGIPVKLVGLGETAADLVAFDPAEYVSALFG